MGPESDDIDAGWDDAPASTPPHVAAGSVPAPSASPSGYAPVSSTEAPFDAVPLVSRRPGAYTSSESLSPAEVVAPLARSEPSSVSRFAPVAVIAALAAASVLWLGHAPTADAPHPPTAARPPSEPVAVVAPSPIAPAPVAPTAVPAPAAESLQLEPLVLEAPNRVVVTVQSVPEGAIFFDSGQRIGTTQVRLNVAPQTTRHLTALLNGYQPLNFKVDGKRETITVRLTPVTAPAPEPAAEAPAASP